jgi:hypothetical protein
MNLTRAFEAFEKIKESINNDNDDFEELLEKIPAELREIIKVGVEKNLQYGHNYHFQDFEQLTGKLTIIGFAPQNDSHIFSCINKSNIEEVVFYYYFGKKNKDEINEKIKTITLEINKPYKVKDVQEIWDEIKLCQPVKRTNVISKKQLDILNAFCPTKPITVDEILWQLDSIPTFTRIEIFEMMVCEISKSQYHTTPQSEREVSQNFIGFGNTLKTAAVSPQALYFLYISGIQPNNKKNQNRATKKRKKGSSRN